MRRGVAERIGERFELYGDAYYLTFLGRDVYVLRHPEHLHEVLIGQADKFAKPSEGLTARQLKLAAELGAAAGRRDAYRWNSRSASSSQPFSATPA